MRRVDQLTAKRGTYIDSCDTREQFNTVKHRLENSSRARLEQMQKELVYIVIPTISKIDGRKIQWQIYLINKE